MATLLDPPMLTPQSGPSSPAGGRFAARRPFVSLLAVDPELGRDVPEAELTAARLASRAHVLHLARGSWTSETPEASGMGYLLLSGLVARKVRVGRRESLELLSEGDLISPWQEDELSLVECDVRWQVLARASAAELDDRFWRAMRAYPQISSALAGRGLRRAKWQAVQAAIAAHPTVQQRLLLMLCHLGERTGRMSRAGILIDLPLSHGLIAGVVHATRPSVTTALLRLRDRGLIDKHDRHLWLITHAGLECASELCESS